MDCIQIEMFRISEPILNLGVHRKLSIQLIPIQLKLNLVKYLHIDICLQNYRWVNQGYELNLTVTIDYSGDSSIKAEPFIPLTFVWKK